MLVSQGGVAPRRLAANAATVARLEAYDWSHCEWITVRRGACDHEVSTQPFEDHLDATNKASGLCQYPFRTRSGLYRISCKMNRRMGWRAPPYQRVSLLHRNENGTWPEVPDDHFYGECFISADGSRRWMRMACRLCLKTEGEGLFYIIAHEAFHYLRRTKQIEGKNV